MKSELEKILVSSYKDEMVVFIKSDKKYFNEAVKLSVSDKQPYAWRAAWLLTSVMEINDKRIKKYLPEIIKQIKIKQGGHKRELLKIILKMELSEKQESKLFDICMEIWEDINNSPSERCTAIKFITNCVEKYPELKQEMSFLFMDHFVEPLTPGAKNSIKKMQLKLGYK